MGNRSRARPDPRFTVCVGLRTKLPLAAAFVLLLSLGPIKDNTLIEPQSPGSLNSNGAGPYFFAGKVGISGGSTVRRGVISFDVASSIPAGSTIASVSLKLHLSQEQGGDQNVSLHRLLADWGEGTSSLAGGRGAPATQGDATWLHRFFDTLSWTTPGGDFTTSASATRVVSGLGFHTWGSTSGMVADVQSWLDDPATSFGWILKGNESQPNTPKRFDSKENGTTANRPVLAVGYCPPPRASLRFSASTYTESESSTKATISLSRTASSCGEVTVQYATSDGSATAGSDYSEASGIITFPDGDTGDRTFVIPILDEAFVEGDETVKITLSNPGGNAGLGDPASAFLIIKGNDTEVDVNEDGFVDIADLEAVAGEFGLLPFENRSDVNGDGLLDVMDLVLVALNQGKLAPRPLQAMRFEPAFPNLSFGQPTNMVRPDDGHDHIMVTSQPGLVHVFPDDQNTGQSSVFLDIRDRVVLSNEEGLLGLAFDPQYRSNGFFYVYYSASSPPRSVISRFSVSSESPNAARSDSEFVIMEIPQPFANHNGGQLVFGPDGYLYIALGDGGSGGDPQGNGQNKNTLLGSILRIDVRSPSDGKSYTVPPDNPFVGVTGAREEIWAYGLRNPWRATFDSHTGRLWAADVGQSSWEEIDIIKKGLNYGWNVMEGNHCFSPSTGCNPTGLELPVAEYSRTGGNCSVTGGYVFRGSGMPSLLGAYIYGDFCSGKVWALRYDGHLVTEQMLLAESGENISSFGQDLDNNLYVLSYGDGKVYSLTPVE